MNKWGFVVSKIDCQTLMKLSFLDICIWCAHHFKPFPGLKCMAGSEWSKFSVKLVNINFVFEALWMLALHLHT